MWDFNNYDDWFTYFDNNIQHRVTINKIMKDGYIRTTKLGKDLTYDPNLLQEVEK